MHRIIFVSDTHLGHDLPVRKTSREHRGEDFFRNFSYVLDYAIKVKASLLVHGGDLFFRARIPEKIVNRVYKLIYEFGKQGIPIVIVPGNHERSRFPRSPLFNKEGIYIFNYPRTFRFDLNGIKLSFSGFPYHYNNIRDNFSRLVWESGFYQSDADYRFLCVHHAVEGSSCGPGNYIFRHAEDVIQMKDIPEEVDALLCGHIHRQQVLYKKANGKAIPVIYAGSVERTSFAEINETKGFYVLHLQKKKSADGFKSFDFIPLQSRPMFQITLDEPDRNSVHELTEDIIRNYPRGSMIRIKTKENYNGLLAEKLDIKRLEQLGYFVRITLPFRKKKRERENRINGLFN